MLSTFEIWILCVAAHCYGDFLLQPDSMAREKRKPGILFLHAGIHGALVYVILQQWTWWTLPGAVFLIHGLIDFFKTRCGKGSKAFAIDQGAHLLSLWALALIASATIRPESGRAIHFQDWILLGAGFTAAVWGVGFYIGTVAKDMCAANRELARSLEGGLKGGGAMIGKLERALIFILVFVGQPAGIGFLVAAKSILRFEEAKKQPLAEYVLIGTLWSFSLAIGLAYLTIYLLP